jgi:uncharacterized protein
MTTPAATPRLTVERFLAAAVSPAPGDRADCYAERFVIEMPFAAGLAPGRTESTREEIRARFAAGAAVRRYTAVRDLRLHQTTDPDVVVVEYTLDGTRVADGGRFSLAFVMVLTFRDDRIVHARDYSDPVAGFRALGRTADLVAALTAGG